MSDELEGAVERSRLLHPSRPVGERCGSRYTVQVGLLGLVSGQVFECELPLSAHVHMRVGRLDFTRHLAVGPRGDVGWSSREADV